MAMIAARVLLGLCAWLALGLAAPAFAAVPDHWITLENACHAVGVTPPAGQDGHMPAQFSCTPDPRDYQHGSLWIKVNAGTLAQAGANPVLMVHSSRFDALRVGFFYADGSVDWQGVERGDYGARWRLGGQIAFIPPDRDAPLSGVVLRFDRVVGADVAHAPDRRGPGAVAGNGHGQHDRCGVDVAGAGCGLQLWIGDRGAAAVPGVAGRLGHLHGRLGAMWSQFHLFSCRALLAPFPRRPAPRFRAWRPCWPRSAC
jgi:hypothetical protein